MLASLKALLAPAGDRPVTTESTERKASARDSDTTRKLRELLNERSRIERLVDAEDDRAVELGRRLEAADAARVSALTAARLDGAAGAVHSMGESIAVSDAIRRDIEDAKAVACNLKAKLAELSTAISGLKPSLHQEAGAFLTKLYADRMLRYNELAPEIAATALQIAAVRRVMIARGCGNSNGWSGQILLPGMKAGIGSDIEPILDAGSREFDQAARREEDEIKRMMREAGFVYGPDLK